MQCVCGFACGFAAAAAQPQSRNVLTASFRNKKDTRKIAGSSACRYNIKNTRGRGNAKPLAFKTSKPTA
jgi:hypothetical protein